MKKAITLLMVIYMLFNATFVANANNIIFDRFKTGNEVKDEYISRLNNMGINAIYKEHSNILPPKALRNKVVSLMYHKISENPEEHNAFCVSPETFENDIIWLKENGYEFLFASEVDEVFESGKYNGKYAVITFDDGYESDFLYAMPILEKHGAKATFFIIGSQLDTEENIKISQLKLLAASESAEIGCHSYELHTLPLEQIKKIYEVDDTIYLVEDFKHCVDLLQYLTGKEIKTLSFPNGIWSKFAVSQLETAGFTEFYTSDAKVSEEAAASYGRINRYDGVSLEELLIGYLTN